VYLITLASEPNPILNFSYSYYINKSDLNRSDCLNGTVLDDGTIWCNDNVTRPDNISTSGNSTTNKTKESHMPMYCSIMIAGLTTSGFLIYLIVDRFDYLCF